MKQKMIKKELYALGILVSFSFLIYACLEDEGYTNQSSEIVWHSNKELTISEAEKWYDANNPTTVSVRSHSFQEQIPVKPNWSKGTESRQGKFEVVETVLMVNQQTIFMDNETKEKYDKDENIIRNVARLVVIKNIETGDMCDFIMVFVGSYNYLKNTKTFERNSYLHREPDFDGNLYFYELDKRLVNGWKYKDGEIVAAISPGTEEGYLMSRGATNCWSEINWIEGRDCWNEIYWDHELGFPGVAAICEKVYSAEYTEACVDLEEGNQSGGDWYSGGGPGGFNPPPTIPPTNPCGFAKSISQDIKFVSRIKDVYNKTFSSGNTMEQGYMQTSKGETIYPGKQGTTSATFTNEQITGKEITEWYHSHPTGSMITSFADLDALATRFQQGYIKSENFTYGIVSEFGCLSLMISSPTDFNVFSTKIRNDQLLGDWNTYVVQPGGGGIDKCIGLLIQFLQYSNSGLSVMFSSNINESNPTWNALELGSNGNSVNMECNK